MLTILAYSVLSSRQFLNTSTLNIWDGSQLSDLQANTTHTMGLAKIVLKSYATKTLQADEV